MIFQIALDIDPIATMLFKIVLLFALMALVCFIMNKRYKNEMDKRSERLQKEYEVLTPSLLATVKDEDLLDVIVANLNAKQDKQNPDPYHTIPLLSNERFEVYGIWLIHHELLTGTFETLKVSPSYPFAEPAINGMERIGAVKCAEAVRAAMETEDKDEIGLCHFDYMTAVDEEKLLDLCIQYVRDNVEQFIDKPDSEETEENA